MRRRDFLLAATALATPCAPRAQTTERVYRIAVLNDGDERTREASWVAFRKRLNDLGVAEARNARFDVQHARDSGNERLAALAIDLVKTKPDVIVCPGTPATLAAKRATASIPIVFLAAGDPTGTGLVQSLSHPGGNVTGVSSYTGEIGVKAIELLREIAPGIQRVANLGDVENPSVVANRRPIEAAAGKLNLSIRLLDSGTPRSLEASFKTIRQERIQGLTVESDGRTLAQRKQIVQFAAQERLPAVYGRYDYIQVGGLMAYEVDRQMIYVRGAEMVHRVLQGVKPADIPVEEINTIRLSLNLKTARALGIAIPPAVRLRADEVIE